MPTILALLGIDAEIGADGPNAEPPFAGRSLVPAMRGDPLPTRPLLLETKLGRGFHAQAVVDGRWKLVADRTGALARSATETLALRPRGSAPSSRAAG